ncbi:B-box zinc finger protein [Methanothermobacter sp. EMTCatA1]|uniref:hypothetical protein n=1 Tax=Methanothermobacter sp. EMTCatA1 TaxID=2017966 RepID=UPI000B60C6CC|nr:hypothetical protein [Methanothermobacter sp. EMTCatA1]BAZ99137.1 hypothetical protein tca_01078 [Methanothermobacter sp. EMTCatA1]HIH71282.1 hypothetical protein [Methanothermobacter thermautotrophicus]
MNCDKHPEREGVASCIICGRILCEECRLKLAGKNYCQSCADKLFQERSLETVKAKGMGLGAKILIALLIILGVLALVSYLIYTVYLAPYYGSAENVMRILMNDPERIIRFLSTNI